MTNLTAFVHVAITLIYMNYKPKAMKNIKEMKPFDEKLHEFIQDIIEDDELSECCGAPIAMGLCTNCREHC